MQPSAYPTQMYNSATQPSNTDRIASYGEVGEIPNAMFTQFMSMFEAENSPNPHDVAIAITDLINTPCGKRPSRIVVGTSFGADIINDATAPVQNETVKALGLAHLNTVKCS